MSTVDPEKCVKYIGHLDKVIPKVIELHGDATVIEAICIMGVHHLLNFRLTSDVSHGRMQVWIHACMMDACMHTCMCNVLNYQLNLLYICKPSNLIGLQEKL